MKEEREKMRIPMVQKQAMNIILKPTDHKGLTLTGSFWGPRILANPFNSAMPESACLWGVSINPE